ncbi:hypothetical protein ACIA5E_18765 [Nocardia asteroides]|uniref:hypothetical protein n=1 Tax=Nocardia asteroides TaxID=1824 RepID=UPI0037B644C3
MQELAIMLHGYGVALHLHAVDEAKQFALSANGPFSRWLASRYGWAMALGWASAIEQHSRENETAIEAFFRVLDEYRAATQHPGPR